MATSKKPAVPAVEKALADRAGKTKPPESMTGEEPKRVLPKGWKPPKTVAEMADAYFLQRAARLAKEKEIELDKAVEAELKDLLIAKLPGQKASGVAGRVCSVSVVQKSTWKIKQNGWSDYYRFIVDQYSSHVKKKDGQQDAAFAYLNRAIGKAAVAEAVEAGVKVPGVEEFKFYDLSVSKL